MLELHLNKYVHKDSQPVYLIKGKIPNIGVIVEREGWLQFHRSSSPSRLQIHTLNMGYDFSYLLTSFIKNIALKCWNVYLF